MNDTIAAPDPTVYRLKANAFVGKRVYRLTEDALTWEEEGKPLDGVFYDEISEARLAFTPTRMATNRYRAQFVLRRGGMVELFNLNYAGIGNFPAQDREYVAFVTELHRRLAAKGKDIAYRRGNSVAAYIGNIALTIFIFGTLAFVFLFLINFGGPWIAIAKLAIILFFVPVLVRYMLRAKPGTYDPLALPADVLPETGASATKGESTA